MYFYRFFYLYRDAEKGIEKRVPVARGNTLTPRSNVSLSCTPGTSGFVVQLKYPIAACGLLQPSEHLRPYFSRACPQDISAPDYHLSAQPVIYAWSTTPYRIILIREFIADIHLEIVISLTDRSSLHTHTLLHIVSRRPTTRYEKKQSDDFGGFIYTHKP